jgi:hypothetical protein
MLVVATVAIVLFAAAAVGGIWLLTAQDSQRPVAVAPPEPAGAPVADAPPPPPPPPVPAPLAGYATPQAAPAPAVVYGPAPAEPPKGSWEAVALVARASQLGPLGGAVGRGLIELQPKLAACFDEDTAARFGTQPHSVAKDAVASDRTTPVLVLEIETGPGEARIVDAPVETQGTASDGAIACAQSVLRGRRFAYPQGQPGGKYRMLHPLTP